MTKFQYWSTALTVTLNAPFTYSMLGVPVLPLVVPGAAVSPGTSNCNWVNVPAVLVREKLAVVATPGVDAVTV